MNLPGMPTAGEKPMAGCGRKRFPDLMGTEKGKVPLAPTAPWTTPSAYDKPASP